MMLAAAAATFLVSVCMKVARWFGSFVVGAVVLACPGCTSFNSERERTDRISHPQDSQADAREERTRSADDRLKTAEFVVTANKSSLVRLQKRLPLEVVHGEEFGYDLVITALNDAQDIVVTDTIPAGASFVRSDPAANRDAQQLFWRFPALRKDGAERIRVWLKADKAGELSSCPTISAAGQDCISTMAGTPQLELRLVAPEVAMMNFDVPAQLVVSNRGTISARHVVVRYNLPAAVAPSRQEQALVFDAGHLAPGQAKSVKLQLKPVVRGKAQIQASAISSNAAPIEAAAAMTITEPKLQVTIEGPAEEYINKNAPYRIRLRNTGDAMLTRVVVAHDAGQRTAVIDAANADSVRSRTAMWKIDSLPPGEERAFDVLLSSSTPGRREHVVTVTTAERVEERAQTSTDWKGISAITLELIDSPDPVQVGHQMVYIIRVSNQGTGRETDIAVVATLPPQLSPVKSSGGEFEGKSIRFRTTSLAPKKFVEYKITAKAATIGEGRMRVELRSGDAGTPVIEEESTRVY
jgi:hypothetical protein